MADFTLRSDQVDVEEIMRQIRARIKEKRGVDYTEEEIRELAKVKLERFLDPRALRSDLLQHYQRQQGERPLLPAPPGSYEFHDTTIYESHRAPLRWIRKLFNPLLKLFFNPNRLIQVLHLQGQINEHNAEQFERLGHREALHYEVINNLVLELTRLGIETRNLKMRLESLSTRLDFDERRARALEGVVQYKTTAAAADATDGEETESAEAGEGDAVGRPGKRRRRRRGRRRLPGEDAGAAPEGASTEASAPVLSPLDAAALPSAAAPTAPPAPDDSPGRPGPDPDAQ